MNPSELVALAEAFTGDPAPITAYLLGIDAGDLPIEALRVDPSVPWSTCELYRDPIDRVSLTAFRMPGGAEIPAHDHPQIHGALRVLRGRIRLTAWDWAPERGPDLALRTRLEELDPSSAPATTRPEQHQVHRIEALEDAVFLDLFVPHYSPERGRVCSYYRVDAPEQPAGPWRLRSTGRTPVPPRAP